MSFNLWHPEFYQGSRRARGYFEGWYAKHVTMDLGESWSFILAISRGENRGDAHSILQVIEGATGRTWWQEGPVDEFQSSTSRFLVRVGKAELSWEGLKLDIGVEGQHFLGEIGFRRPKRLPFHIFSPGVMGPFSFLPFMECRHGLISLDHELEGGFSIDGRRVDMEGGRGYLEKDWGSSMPKDWIWTQSNNFPATGDSFMFSVATIPWLGASFPGFLCAGSLSGRTVREATYTGARLEELVVEDRKVQLAVTNRDERFEIEVERSLAGILKAPVKGSLSRRITESVDAVLTLRWTKGGKVLFEGSAPKAGLEIAGDPTCLRHGSS